MPDLTRFFHSRNCTMLMFLIAVAAACVAWHSGEVTPLADSGGLLCGSPNAWIAGSELSLVVALALMAAVAVCAIALNSVYNFMRDPSALAASLFMAMIMAMPSIAGAFCSGQLMCLLFIGLAAVLFGSYADTAASRRVFLVFFALSAGAMFQYACIYYIPVFLLGMAQMRVFRFKTLLAALIGLITPLWILYAFGYLSAGSIRWPEFYFTIYGGDFLAMLPLLLALVVTVVLGFSAMTGTLMKMLSYNAKYRAFNGFLAIMLLATILFIIIDFINVSVYLPVLILLSAYQMAHYFSLHRSRKSWWAPASVFAAYFLLYLSNYLL